MSDADIDIQVAGNTAVFTHFALIGETQTGIVRHSGRHGHTDITSGAHATMTKAGRTRIFDNGTVSFAAFTWRSGHHLAEHGAYHALGVALSMAVGALRRLGAFLAPCSGAFLT